MTARHKALWRHLCDTVTGHRQTVWESLNEPRHVTLATMTGYTMGFAFAVVILSSVPGQLPDGVYTARFVAAIALAVGSLMGVPGAWRGWWFLEEVGAVFWLLGIVVLGVAIWRDDMTGMQTAEAMFLVGLAFLAAIVRILRVHKSPYRLGAGPLLPEARVEVTIAEAMEAHKNDKT